MVHPQVQNMFVPAEEFEHPVEGFQGANTENHEDQFSNCPLIKIFPGQKKEEKPGQGQPFEEFDPGGKGKKRKRKA